jgi:hypothetical protein
VSKSRKPFDDNNSATILAVPLVESGGGRLFLSIEWAKEV